MIYIKLCIMSTIEDIFWLYENVNNRFSSPIISISIGDIDSIPKYNRLSYIRPGHTCPICLDDITHKTNAYITSCGHGFHKSCIVSSYITTMTKNIYSTYKCPMCRANIGTAIEYINERYSTTSGLDILENFWYKQSYMVPIFCDNKCKQDDIYHYLGLNSKCEKCIQYRNNNTILK